VLEIIYLSNGPNQATGNDLKGSGLVNYINSDPQRGSVHHYAFLAPGGPLPGVVGIAWLGTTCLSNTNWARYKASINEVYLNNPTRSADTLAHEIGHALGMDHDFYYNSQNQRVGYVLQTSNGQRYPCMNVGGIMDYYNTKNKWSPCSNYFLNRYMQGRYCMSMPANGQCNSGWDTTAPVAPTSPPVPSADCDQYGSDSVCASKASQCNSNPLVKVYCRKTCSNCNECSDYDSNVCPVLTDLYCYDGIYNNKFKNYRCIKRCKGCTGDSGIEKPAGTGCNQYQSDAYCNARTDDECRTDPKVMVACRNRCGTCKVCSDLATNCGRFTRYCNKGYSWMDRYYCVKTCNECL